MKTKHWIMFFVLNIPIYLYLIFFFNEPEKNVIICFFTQTMILAIYWVFTSIIPSTIGEIREGYKKYISESHTVVSENLTTKLTYLTLSIAGIAIIGLTSTNTLKSTYSFSLLYFILSLIAFFVSTDIYDSSKNVPFMYDDTKCLNLTKRGARIYQVGFAFVIVAIIIAVFSINELLGIISSIIFVFTYVLGNLSTSKMALNPKKNILILSITLIIAYIPCTIICIINSYFFSLNNTYIFFTFLIVFLLMSIISIYLKLNPDNEVNHNFIIAIEGIDGTGKTAVAELLAHKVGANNLRTPSRTIAEFRKSVDSNIKPEIRLHLYQTILTIAKNEIEASNSPIIFDRYWPSVLVLFQLLYNKQPDNKLNTYLQQLMLLVNNIPKPNLFVLLTAKDETIFERINSKAVKGDTDKYVVEDVEFRKNALLLFNEYKRIGEWIEINTNDKSIDQIVDTIIVWLIRKKMYESKE